jgi:hypothetical protein
MPRSTTSANAGGVPVARRSGGASDSTRFITASVLSSVGFTNAGVPVSSWWRVEARP